MISSACSRSGAERRLPRREAQGARRYGADRARKPCVHLASVSFTLVGLTSSRTDIGSLTLCRASMSSWHRPITPVIRMIFTRTEGIPGSSPWSPRGSLGPRGLVPIRAFACAVAFAVCSALSIKPKAQSSYWRGAGVSLRAGRDPHSSSRAYAAPTGQLWLARHAQGEGSGSWPAWLSLAVAQLRDGSRR